ncbi:MAG TPA: cytochrome b N-terminal domain-containing protein [Candidatus Binataceae bacterium]|nr:cytochrome b N-terminal domain-containing protein [Candidatus Binataceae bacterium]
MNEGNPPPGNSSPDAAAPGNPPASTRRSVRDFFHLIYVSIFRSTYPTTVRQRLAVVVNNLVLHVHPTRIYQRSISPSYTLGLGLICFYLFIIEWVTGVYLMFYYEPSTGAAYGRILDLDQVVTFGRVMRNLHRWGGEAMVAAAALHMCRVFYTGSYKPPREFNWVLGVGLLFLTLALSFTGYLLPWDQLSFWAITVGTNIATYAPKLGPKVRYLLLGGPTVGSDALLRFYTLHVIAVPSIAATVINYHIWRVSKDGGLAAPTENEPSDEPGAEVTPQPTSPVIQTFPTVLYVELAAFAALMALLLVVSVWFNAPLEQQANPLQPNNPSKAPWYFLGLQEMVSYSAFWGGVMVPTLLTVFLVALPYFDRKRRGIGIWFAKERRPIMILWTVILAGIILTTAIGVFCRGPNWKFYWPWEPWPGPPA